MQVRVIKWLGRYLQYRRYLPVFMVDNCNCTIFGRVTILCNKFDGHPKGFAYVEFADKDSVQTAMALDDSLFRGRQIKVSDSVGII